MNRLRIKFLIAPSLGILSLTLGMSPTVHAECVPYTEVIDVIVSNEQGDLLYYHHPEGAEASDCPTDYHSTVGHDMFKVGSVMPTFHFSADNPKGEDGVFFNSPINADFSGSTDIAGFAISFSGGPNPFVPYNITLVGNDGYNQFQGNRGPGSGQPASDAIVTWYALDGDDVLIGGDYGIDYAHGGRGNDIYNIANNEDRVYELPDEGFDVVSIRPSAPAYKFDYTTSIEGIYLYPGATVDRNFLPENVIFLDFLLDNRGPSSNYDVSEYLRGTPNNDSINGGSGDSKITGEGGTDIINGGLGNDQVDGGGGNDALIGGPGNDTVQGGEGNDLVVGGSGEGNDTYNGGVGIDTVKYTSAKDGIIVNLSAKTNQATSVAPGDAARIGVDQIALVENVIAGNFNDQVIGDKLANTLDGEDGNDLIKGEKGNDILIGGRGSDTLIGGAGNEVFVYRTVEDSAPSAPDTITDFSVGKEKIDLSQIDASSLVDGNNTFMFNGASPIGTSSQGEISVVKVDNPGKTNDYMMIYIDTDADPDPEAAIRVNKLLKLSVKNFVL